MQYRLGKHRGKYVIKYTDEDGKPVRRSLGTDDKGLAESEAERLWRALTSPQSERVADLWPVYVQDRLKEVARKDRFKATWAALEPHFGHRLGPSITADQCRAYWKARKEAGMADSTAKTELELLRACLRMTLGDRAPKLWMPPDSKPRDRWLTPEEVNAVHGDARTAHVALFIELAIATGARMSAILDLTWDRVNLADGFVDLQPAGRHKTNKRRAVVPINQRALKALIEAKRGALTDYVVEWNGKPVKSVRKALERISKRTGIPFSAHVLRHTAGVWMAQRNVPMQQIAQYLGHESMRITERVYARYSPGFLKDAAAALEW